MSGIRNLTRLPGIRSSTRSRSRIRTDASRARERVDAWEVCIKSPHSPYVSRSLDPCFPIYQPILFLHLPILFFLALRGAWEARDGFGGRRGAGRTEESAHTESSEGRGRAAQGHSQG